MIPVNVSSHFTHAYVVCSNTADEYDAYIVVSFTNATLVLSIGETVEEVTDSGFLGTTPTLSCSRLGDDALIQVYPEGIRHIRADKRINEWRAPGKRVIVRCALNERQAVLALSGGEIVYFEMDQVCTQISIIVCPDCISIFLLCVADLEWSIE